MILTIEQIQEIIKHPRADLQNELREATRHDSRLFLHTQPEEKDRYLDYLKEFRSWVQNFINGDKFRVFEHLLTLPVKTIGHTNGIMDEIKKVFEAQDRYIKYNFSNPDLEKDFTDFLEAKKVCDYWSTDGFQIMKSAPNSFICIDLASDQIGNQPEPYFFTVKPRQVIDTMPNSEGNLEYFIFRADGFVYAYDDGFYRKFQDKDPYPIVLEVKHELGYTPANTFWDTKYNEEKKIQKQNPLTKSLGDLDWLLFMITSGNHLASYAGFPIIVTYEQKCTYTDEMTGTACNDGFLAMPANGVGLTSMIPCPKCSERKKILGPGTFITVPGPASKDDPDLISGVNIVSGDVESLKWIGGDIESQIAWITYNSIGVADVVTKEAINEKQVTSQFESRINVLYECRDNFQRIQKFTEDTLARLRYGDAFIGSTINYGQRFFLYSVDQLQTNYQEARKTGEPMYELAEQRRQINQTRYKNNPEMMERVKILAMIEPYADLSVEQLITLNQTIDIVDYYIKLKANLDGYIARFEREFTDIVSFMQFVPLEKKIDFINETLKGYIDAEPKSPEVALPAKTTYNPPKPSTGA